MGHGECHGDTCVPTRGHSSHKWVLIAIGLCILPVGSAWSSLPKFVFFELSLSEVAMVQGLTFSFLDVLISWIKLSSWCQSRGKASRPRNVNTIRSMSARESNNSHIAFRTGVPFLLPPCTKRLNP